MLQANTPPPAKPFDIFLSVIRATLPHANTYIIADNSLGFSNMVATRADNGASLRLQGTQSITTLEVGTHVIVAIFPGQERRGYILAAVPAPVETDVNIYRSLEMRSQTGMLFDTAYSALLQRDESAAQSVIPDMSNSTPIDALPGDWGYITDAGLFVLLGSLRASLGASAFCKLDFFALDELARLTSTNFEHRGPALDHRILNDGGEYNEIRMLAPNTWEGAGKRLPGNPFDLKDGKFVDKDAYYEPFDEGQQGIFRNQEFKGFIANGETSIIAALSLNFSADVLKYSDKSPYVGLSEVHKSANGAYTVKSAKEITFEKTIVIPVPKEMVIPEDALGDNPDNYSAAGVLGETVQELAEYNPDMTTLAKIAAIHDYHAYLYNKYNIAGFVGHEKDWHVPEEASGDNSVKQNVGFIEDGGLYKPGVLNSFKYELPPSGVLIVDSRDGNVPKYYVGRSMIKQMEDGSILFEDAYGSQIIMGQGNITLSCPGDIISMPGRSNIVMAPKDIINRAGSSVDITASKGDVRLKAERNLHMLGGNSERGGVLIESKGSGKIQSTQFDAAGEAVSAPGIILKASDSDVYVYGKEEVYIGVNADVGSIVLDAKNGNIFKSARTIIENVEETLVTNVGDDTSFILSAKGGILTSQLVTDTLVVASKDKSSVAISGGLYVEDIVLTKGQVAAVGGIVSETGVSIAPAKPGSISDPVGVIQSKVDDLQQSAEEITTTVSLIVEELQERLIDGASSPASEETFNSIAFTLRTPADYGLDAGFEIYESRWQQLYRDSGAAITWEEPPVSVQGKEDTYPYPGKDKWEDEDVFIVADMKNFDIGTGFAKARDDMDVDGATFTRTKLKGGYLITKQKT